MTLAFTSLRRNSFSLDILCVHDCGELDEENISDTDEKQPMIIVRGHSRALFPQSIGICAETCGCTCLHKNMYGKGHIGTVILPAVLQQRFHPVDPPVTRAGTSCMVLREAETKEQSRGRKKHTEGRLGSAAAAPTLPPINFRPVWVTYFYNNMMGSSRTTKEQ